MVQMVIDKENAAVVSGGGAAHVANVKISGALMDMLATVYSHILMSAIREAIQNAADATVNAGKPLSSVMVHLPTADNPVIRVIDQGLGMTGEFMTSKYLTFGESTKAGDDGAAGGLGVGRWAAYGYIRECTIITTAEDQVTRVYFQYQDADGMPSVQPAAETPFGAPQGTEIMFPVKETDIDVALHAVSWLQEVMRITMGACFTVDSPARLLNTQGKPLFEITPFDQILNLEEIDPTLKGIRVIPCAQPWLRYDRKGQASGSLIVTTNKEKGVGGLPFHVSQTSESSIFHSGSIIEIPMSYRIPFMPSREEVKYTDEMFDLMGRIDRAAHRQLVKLIRKAEDSNNFLEMQRVAALFNPRSGCKPLIKFAESELFKKLSEDAEIKLLTSAVHLSFPTWNATDYKLCFKKIAFDEQRRKRTSQGYLSNSGMFVTRTTKGVSYERLPLGGKPLVVINDRPKHGFQAVQTNVNKLDNSAIYYLSGDKEGLAALEAVLKTKMAGLPIIKSSSLELVGDGEVKAKRPARAKSVAGQLPFFDRTTSTLSEAYGSLVVPVGTQRLWIEKNGGAVPGFEAKAMQVIESLANCLKTLTRQKEIYVLPKKTVNELTTAIAQATDSGLWDADPSDFDEDSEFTYVEIQALKEWVHIPAFIHQAMLRTPIYEEVAAGRATLVSNEYTSLNQFVRKVAANPLIGSTGSYLDKMLSPYLDILTGEPTKKLKFDPNCTQVKFLVQVFSLAKQITPGSEFDSFKADASKLASGYFCGNQVWKDLIMEFPLLDAYYCASLPAARESMVGVLALAYGNRKE